MEQEKLLFEELKREVSKTFLQDFPSSNPDISQWKGLDIIYFQEHLRQKVRGNVSEKWFYTYFKSPFEKLPRIDMLNLLAQYCGYRRGWSDFVEKHGSKEISGNSPDESGEKSQLNPSEAQTEIITTKENIGSDKEAEQGKLRKPGIKKIIYLIIGVLVISAGIWGFIKYYEYKNTYVFCFYDSDRGSLIRSSLEIVIQKEGFSPEYYTINNGCFSYRSNIDTLRMTLNSPMYKKESFVVGLKEIRDKGEDNHRNFKLRPDDYAIMLFYYSTSVGNNADEKQKAQLIRQRKAELNKLIADDALIYQVYDSELFGVEVLDKKKYIDFMTTPTTSLKNYVLITSQVNNNNKINLIKFKIQKDEN